MAQATVKTVQVIDPRIEPQPDPLYNNVIGPTQNQYYKIQSSGRSNHSITFNNLTTLGVDRAYLDTMEVEVTVDIRFHTNKGAGNAGKLAPYPFEWTFDSFPLNKCCEEARVNINGGAFFSQPLSYVRAKERYMDQKALCECYENICPIHKPILQTESGKIYSQTGSFNDDDVVNLTEDNVVNLDDGDLVRQFGLAAPTRLGYGMTYYMQGPRGVDGGFNNSFLHSGPRLANGKGFENIYFDGANNQDLVVRARWREPLFCSPFTSRYDATYGRPLYNITSMDITLVLMDLGNMIRVTNLTHDPATEPYITGYDIDIVSAFLCYQVLTIPPTLNKPNTTLVPYRRFVPYITDATPGAGDSSNTKLQIKSGVYTLNEVPTAIWVFCAPEKRVYQTNNPDTGVNTVATNGDYNSCGNWDSNKLFAFLENISITMANTTQILETAEIQDLYRIAKANGCQDSFWSWAMHDNLNWRTFQEDANHVQTYSSQPFYGAGSVLRLIPGVDIVLPDQALIPGANANNMVLQVGATFHIPPHSAAQNNYALWLLFEYVGVAAISPGQCEITMNPLGSGEIMAVSPVISGTSQESEGVLSGSGFWDNLRTKTRAIATSGAVSRLLKALGFTEIGNALEKAGMGQCGSKAAKRARGGAVIGLGDWC